MSRVLVVSASTLVLAAVVGGGLALALQHRRTGSATSQPGQAGTIPYPDGPRDLVLRMSLEGGLQAPVGQAAREPTFSLYGDGTVVTEGPPPTVPSPPPVPPALPDLRTVTVSPAGIQAILGQANAAGLFGPSRDYGGDAPSEFATQVFALSLGPIHRTVSFAGGAVATPRPGAPPAERLAGERFAELGTKLLDLTSWLPAGSVGQQRAYEFERMAVYVGAGGADQNRPSTVDWPLSGRLAGFGQLGSVDGYRCAVVSGDQLAALLPAARGATVGTLWRSEGRTYPAVFRPLLPDDSGC
jgi:hypothetical protein